MKRLKTTTKLGLAVLMLAWVTFFPPAAVAFENCQEFWAAAWSYCDSYGYYLCGGQCWEWQYCPDPENPEYCPEHGTDGWIQCCLG